MKQIIILITTILYLSLNGSAPTELGSTASERYNWNFEISNKFELENGLKNGRLPIFVTLRNVNNNVIIPKTRITPKDAKLRAALSNQDISSPLTLIIEHGMNPIEKFFIATITPQQCIKKVKGGACVNKIFLTFECSTGFFSDSAKLRPQRGIGGALSGFINMSESGISLQYNIKHQAISTKLSKRF